MNINDEINNLINYYKKVALIYDKYKNINNKIDTEVDDKNASNLPDLIKQYDIFDTYKFISKNNLFSNLINKKIYIDKTMDLDKLIYPFNFNISQINALKTALTNSISVIQGPPGTGKTQSILNIILNIIYLGKTVALISNNNEAVNNVYDKLHEKNYGSLCAKLGKKENVDNFFNNINKNIPNSFNELVDNENLNIKELLDEEIKRLKLENELANLRIKKEEFEIDLKKQEYTLNPFKIKKINDYNEIFFLAENIKIKYSNKISLSKQKNINFFKRLYYKFKYGISRFKKQTYSMFYDRLVQTGIIKKEEQINKKIIELENEIKKYENKKYKEKIIYKSESLLNEYLKNNVYTIDSNFDINSFKELDSYKKFVKRFPIVMSTVLSLKNSMPQNYKFDYIIIDEASQCNITSVIPILLRCKKLIIVGDTLQIPPVINKQVIKEENNISTNIDTLYKDKGNSFLDFILNIYNDKIKPIMLKEHYRCNSLIIGFNNKRIYDNNLIILNNQNNDLPFIIKNIEKINKPKNHRQDKYNQDEIDAIKEVLDEINVDDDTSIGIITPYNLQLSEIKRNTDIDHNKIESGTIHTFQGKEKDIIILSTVTLDVNNFINEEYMINVAVSRAKKQFILICSKNIYLTNIGIISDLVKYINYNTNSKIEEIKIKSIFNLLYEDIQKVRDKNDLIISELILKKVLDKMLSIKEYKSLWYAIHVRLTDLLRINKDEYDNDEYRYLTNSLCHVDFVIYNKYNKKPVFAIEVDGVKYHKDNKEQLIKDKIKDKCFRNCNLFLLRLPTDGSNEEEKIKKLLDDYLSK